MDDASAFNKNAARGSEPDRDKEIKKAHRKVNTGNHPDLAAAVSSELQRRQHRQDALAALEGRIPLPREVTTSLVLPAEIVAHYQAVQAAMAQEAPRPAPPAEPVSRWSSDTASRASDNLHSQDSGYPHGDPDHVYYGARSERAVTQQSQLPQQRAPRMISMQSAVPQQRQGNERSTHLPPARGIERKLGR